MKKALFSLSLMIVSAMAFAGNSVEIQPVLDDNCTISTTIDFNGSNVTITGTGSNCNEAAASLQEGLNNIKFYIF